MQKEKKIPAIPKARDNCYFVILVYILPEVSLLTCKARLKKLESNQDII